jgi:hypothetical protein
MHLDLSDDEAAALTKHSAASDRVVPPSRDRVVFAPDPRLCFGQNSSPFKAIGKRIAPLGAKIGEVKNLLKKLSEFVVNPFRATTVFLEAATRVLSSCALDAFMEDALAPAVILSS